MDVEKVIKGLECCTFILGKRKCNECPYQKGLPDNGCYQLQDDFHALPKERVAVVRCKDCKHGVKSATFRYYPNLTWCNQHSTSHNDDWFCADGIAKDTDALNK